MKLATNLWANGETGLGCRERGFIGSHQSDNGRVIIIWSRRGGKGKDEGNRWTGDTEERSQVTLDFRVRIVVIGTVL